MRTEQSRTKIRPPRRDRRESYPDVCFDCTLRFECCRVAYKKPSETVSHNGRRERLLTTDSYQPRNKSLPVHSIGTDSTRPSLRERQPVSGLGVTCPSSPQRQESSFVSKARRTSIISRGILAVGIPLAASHYSPFSTTAPTTTESAYLRHSILNVNAIELQQQASAIMYHVCQVAYAI